MSKIRPRAKIPAHLLQYSPRGVEADVPLAGRRQPRQQQPRPASDFQNSFRRERPNGSDRLLHPYPHFLGRDRRAGVAAHPTGQIEVTRRLGAVGVHLIVKLSPFPDMPIRL